MGEGQGPHLREQDLGRTIRDTGERERGAHRDTEGGWAGFTHTTGSQGFPSRNRTKLHPAARGQARASYWLRSPSSPASDKGQRQARSAVLGGIPLRPLCGKKKENSKGGMGEDGTPPPHRDFKERGVMR